MNTIALFGTSADPPTAGHKAILKWLCDRYDGIAAWASDNPFKSHQTPLEHRKRMLRVLISEIDTPQNNIALHEELSSGRTLETVKKAKEIWGEEVEYTLIIGSDLVSQLPKWYEVEKLLAQVQLLVVPRPGYEINDEDIQRLRQLGARVEVADLQVPAVSSTEYREKGDSEVLTPPVEDYIHQEQLYECQNAAPSR
ncbi:MULTISPECIES: nicotinate-nucleotide adenylyltransferase [unclassified Coleofasciculus]|uniref:nicotinate-nucleotide adenylyltransferase n=1 Tax=unclassified Coleofasciculus TaxID=2692782 RepID=UPI00187E19BC|nr:MULTISPECIES: nicotinate-nucleotide adenylyltransferase [unclassified Coleofasciculus]MBE9127047.1 nicotinate-nucleotide adenylyltransferase [Coleofasciculus sp. LEGE 07081]MBE9147274.1 nicotinate-nucleotide adenylyltransferase [Coleofasciculus sp. LEGE 07092]